MTPTDEAPSDFTFEELDAPIGRRAIKLYELWCARRPDGGIPNRVDLSFELLGAAGLLGFVFVIEPVDGGDDWQYRLMGTELTSYFRKDATGIPFRRLFGRGVADAFIALSNRAARTRTPLFLHGRIAAAGNTGPFETMSLPVWSRDGSEVWLMGGSFPEH